MKEKFHEAKVITLNQVNAKENFDFGNITLDHYITPLKQIDDMLNDFFKRNEIQENNYDKE